MKRILITGGAGFIGSKLALKLMDRGHEVSVLDSLSPQVHTSQPEQSAAYLAIRGRVKFLRADIRNRAALLEALQGQDVVVHLAAETGTGQSMYEIERYSSVNVGGTALLLDILANVKHEVRKVVVASSRAVYGEGKYFSPELGHVYPKHRSALDMSAGDFAVKYPGCTQPIEPMATDEDSMIHPSSVYGITKQVQEQLVMTVCPSIGIAPVSFRYQNVYGPGQALSNPYTGILSIFSNLIMSGRPINIFEDGKESRDFVYIDDVVDATALGVESDAADNGIFNVGSGQPVDVMTVARALSRELKGNVPIQISGNFRIGDIRHNYASLTRLNSTLGFNPAYDFDKGIAEFCRWVTSMGAVNSGYEASLQEMRDKGLLK